MTDHGAGSDSPSMAGGPPQIGGSGPPDEPALVVCRTPDEVSAEAAARISAGLQAAIDERGRADFVTTGGSAPIGIYGILASSMRDRVDWARVHFWWGDDRYVPQDHLLSNVQPADAILFGSAQPSSQAGNVAQSIDAQVSARPGLVVPAEHVHPFPCAAAISHARGAAWCAAQYAIELQRAGLRLSRGFPVFDVVLVGLGPDGHVMSVFPGSDAFDRSEWAMAIPAPTHVAPHVERVTLNPAILGVAGSVLLVTSGSAKEAVIGEIFRSERNARLLPAQLVRHHGATWILDQAAAAAIPDRLVHDRDQGRTRQEG